MNVSGWCEVLIFLAHHLQTLPESSRGTAWGLALVIICSQRGPLIKQALHLLVQTVVRVALPVVIREFIRWLAAEDEGSARGWTMAGAVIALSIISLVVYHKVFWCEPMA